MKMFELYFGLILLFIYVFIKLAYRRNLTSGKGAPFVPLEADTVKRVLQLAEIKKGDVFYDLGSGDGRLVIAAALEGAVSYGFEIDLIRVWYSRLWIKLLGLSKNARIVRQNIYNVDFLKADIVTAYLLQETNDKLSPKLKREIKKGARVIGIAFNFSGLKLVKIDPRGPIYGPLYLYKN